MAGDSMKANFGGVSDVAEMIGVTPGRVRELCRKGRVVGAEHTSSGWVIPLPVHVLPANAKYRRPGAIDAAMGLPGFLERRLPKKTAV